MAPSFPATPAVDARPPRPSLSTMIGGRGQGPVAGEWRPVWAIGEIGYHANPGCWSLSGSSERSTIRSVPLCGLRLRFPSEDCIMLPRFRSCAALLIAAGGLALLGLCALSAEEAAPEGP